MAVTLQDIADDLGLNISTVSRVLSRPDSTFGSPATRKRIREAARRLGYRPNAQARALASGRSGCVGILVPEFSDLGFAAYLQTLTDVLAEHGLLGVPLHCGSSDEDQVARLELLRSRQLDAAICLYHHPENQPAYDQLQNEGHLLIFRFTQPPPPLSPGTPDRREGVKVDLPNGYRTLVDHLWEQGYERIAVLGGSIASRLASPNSPPHPASGVSWFLEAMERHGLAWSPQQAIPCQRTSESVYAALGQWLDDRSAQGESCDALIVQSNRLLPGVWRVLMDRNIRVPESMGLATLTDTELSRFAPVPVTVWHQPIEAICRDLVALLIRRIADPQIAAEIRRQNSFLIKRNSTARSSAPLSASVPAPQSALQGQSAAPYPLHP